MSDNAGINCAGNFTFKTHNDAQDADVNCDVQLSMQGSKKHCNQRHSNHGVIASTKFAIKPAAENYLFGDRGDDGKCNKSNGAIDTGLEIVKTNILGFAGIKPTKTTKQINYEGGNENRGDKTDDGKSNIREGWEPRKAEFFTIRFPVPFNSCWDFDNDESCY